MLGSVKRLLKMIILPVTDSKGCVAVGIYFWITVNFSPIILLNWISLYFLFSHLHKKSENSNFNAVNLVPTITTFTIQWFFFAASL